MKSEMKSADLFCGDGMSTATKEYPILFSGEMVRAILAGRKTQTRRVIDCSCNSRHITGNLLGEWGLSVPPHRWEGDPEEVNWQWCGKRPEIGDWIEQFQTDVDDHASSLVRCPYGKPGDRLWIKASYTTRYDPDFHETHWKAAAGGWIVTHGQSVGANGKLKRNGVYSARLMPKWLSAEFRLPILEITDIRVERVRDISEADAEAEGVKPTQHPLEGHIESFAKLWDEINAKRGFAWYANPWVWVVEFKRVKNEQS